MLALPLLMSACATTGKNEAEPPKPEDAPGYIAAGDELAQRRDFENALVQYVLALEADDSIAATYYKIGFIHQTEGRDVVAERSFRQALAKDPDYVPAQVALGRALLRKERFEEASRLLNRAVELQPGNWRAMNALGIMSDLENDFTQAASLYDRALELNPRAPNVLNNYGYSFYLQRRWVEAERWFRRAVDADETFEQAWSNLALVYLQLGDEAQARAAFERFLPAHQAANNVGYFRLLNDDAASARREFESARRDAPSYYALAERNLASLKAGAKDNSAAARAARQSVTPAVPDQRSAPDVAMLDNGRAGGETSVRAPVATASRSAPRAESVATRQRREAAALKFSAFDIRRVQQRLVDLGYDVGRPDGSYGERTREALRAYQIDNRLLADGELTPAMVARLR